MTFDEWVKRPNMTMWFVFEMEAAQGDGQGGTNTKTYRFCDIPQGGVFNGEYYEDDLFRFSDYRRDMQSILRGDGRALVSYGNLTLSNSKGTYNELLNVAWNSQGKKITGKVGGQEIPFSEFNLFLTGIVTSISGGRDNTVTIVITDELTSLLNKQKLAGAYIGKLPDLIKEALIDAGFIYPTGFNQTLWNQFIIDCNYDVSVTLNDSATLWTYLNELTKGLLLWYGIGRDGLFEIARFAAPTSAEVVATYDELDLATGEVATTLEDVYWSVSIKWSGGTETQQDAAIKTVFPNAKEMGAKETAITTLADAQTERDRWWALLSVRRVTKTTTVLTLPFTRHLGHVVNLQHADLGINGYFRIRSIEDNINNGTVKLALFQ